MRSRRSTVGVSDEKRTTTRRRVLEQHGAVGATLETLMALNRSRVEMPRRGGSILPLPDEPHIADWQAYADDARRVGAWEALRTRLVQLMFPIRTGMSREPKYLRATLRGVVPEATGEPGLGLLQPEGLRLILHASIGGRVPVLEAAERADFVTLVQALAARGEPRFVPDSMGACLVSGLNNWDRVRRYRKAWEKRCPSVPDEPTWLEEFHRLSPRKELYQDRLILLAPGAYSNVPAPGSEPEVDWLARSLVIRREHECTHYFTLRVFGALQHNVLEELVADFVGILAGFGTYQADLAALFLGLESFPAYRAGGRLENYRGNPPVGDAAFEVLQRLTHSAILNLERLYRESPGRLAEPEALARAVFALIPLSLEELAARDFSPSTFLGG